MERLPPQFAKQVFYNFVVAPAQKLPRARMSRQARFGWEPDFFELMPHRETNNRGV
jgi:hypothetical protein